MSNRKRTTVHWEWKDGGSSVYPREGVPKDCGSVPIAVVYCTLGWHRTRFRFDRSERRLIYASLSAPYVVWKELPSWVNRFRNRRASRRRRPASPCLTCNLMMEWIRIKEGSVLLQMIEVVQDHLDYSDN